MSNERDGLLEYEKTIDLFSHEDRLAWELVSIWIALQAGLGSAAVLLHAQGVKYGVLSFSLIFIIGVISSLAWGFMMFKSNMWRNNWLLYGLRLERELNARGIRLNIFEFMRRARFDGIALEYFKDKTKCETKGEIRVRNQRRYERITALKLAHWGMFGLAFFWFILFLINLGVIRI